MKDLTHNPGILPIDLGPAKLQRSEHTFVHQYNLEPLLSEFKNLNIQFDNIKNTFKNSSMIRETSSYINTINLTQNYIRQKMDNINLHATNRRKRGIFNGLGYIIKGVTGNLDAYDGKRFNKILSHLESNQENIMDQLNMQYSFNIDIVENFNKTIKNIQHNEILLQSRIVQLSQMMQENSDHTYVFFGKDLLNQLVILYNNILNMLQDIENSITFCKLGTLHPSIITSKQLFEQIEKLSNHYKNQFAFDVKYENILDFESMIKINCKIEPNKIIYFLSIPIDFETKFNLFHLLPIPTTYESEFASIIPNIRYILKADNLIKPLSGICTQSKPYHCSSQLVANFNASCEEEIIFLEKTEKCTLTKLDISENHVEIIADLNQYLAVFPKAEKIFMTCENRKESKELKGIFLIENGPCEIFFRGNKLNFLEKTYGSPLLFNIPKFSMQKQNTSEFSIQLKTLDLEELPINHMKTKHAEDLYTPSLWTVFLYIVLILILIYCSKTFVQKKLQYFGKKKTKAQTFTDAGTEQETETLKKLPGGASF